MQLQHRVRVFVFRYREEAPDYLLLRGSQGIESFWTPIHGAIGFGEKLGTALRREVADDTGILRPEELIDLQMTSRWTLGDEEVVEWNFGFRAVPQAGDVSLDDRWAEFRWANFGAAYPSLEFEPDRAAIMRLHTLLGAA